MAHHFEDFRDSFVQTIKIGNILLVDFKIIFLPRACLVLLVLVRAWQKNDFEVNVNKKCSEFLLPVPRSE